MACTKIVTIHHTLNKSLDYISDPNKTALNNAMDYIMNSDKTEQGLYISSFNCGSETAYDEMKQTQAVWGKPKAKVLGYHVMQSFKPGEVTPDIAHQIGCEFVQRCLAKKYEVIVSTHLNKNHLHNHIIFNSVSFTDGKMYRNNFADYYRDIRAISDDLCRQYSLSVISDPSGKSRQYAEWKADKDGKPTWRGMIGEDVERAIRASMSFQTFLRNLKEQGYEVKTGVKHLAVRPPGKERFVRLRSLGEQYTEETIKQRILAQQRPEHSSRFAVQKLPLLNYDGTFTLHKVTWKGLRALYFHYLHMLRKAKRSPYEAAFLLREDLVRMDKISDQAKLLGKNKIDTAEQLDEYRKGLESQINQMTVEKKALRNEMRRGENQDITAELSARISDISRRLKPLRHELGLCYEIVEYSVLIKEKEDQLRTSNERKELKDHESSGRGRSNREHGA